MEVLERIVSLMQEGEEGIGVSVSEKHVSVFSSSAAASKCGQVPVQAEGSGTLRRYNASHFLHCLRKKCTHLREENGVLEMEIITDMFSIMRKMYPIITPYPPRSEDPDPDYSSRVSMKADVFRKVLQILDGASVSVFLSDGVLYFCSTDADGERTLQVTKIVVLEEGTEKIHVPLTPLKGLGPLLALADGVSLMFSSSVFAFLALFRSQGTRFNVFIRGLHE